MPELLAPTQREIAAVLVQLRSADDWTWAQVERLARQVTAEAFARAVGVLDRRRATGSVENDAGYLVYLLRLECDRAARDRAQALADAQSAAGVEVPIGHVERIRRTDPERYVRSMLARFPGFDVDAFVRQYVGDSAEQGRLLELANELRAAA